MDSRDIAKVITHVILFLFALVVLLFHQFLFGVTMVFLATPFTSKNNKLFQMLSLYLAAIFNNIALMDNTTYCMNALYSILFYLAIMLMGSLFFYSLLDEEDDDDNDNQTIALYLKLLVVLIFDIVYYSLSYSNTWMLLVVFVSFLCFDKHSSQAHSIKFMFYLLGFLVNGFSLPIGQWISYTVLIVALAAIDKWIE